MNDLLRILTPLISSLLLAAGMSGCLDLESDGGAVAASSGTVAFQVQPVKGPFSSVSRIQAFAIKSSSRVQSFAVSSTAPAGGVMQVTLPKSAVEQYDQIVLEYDGKFSGDRKADGTVLNSDMDIRKFRQPIDASTVRTAMSTSVTNDVLGTRFDGGIADHIATTLALKKSGLLNGNSVSTEATAQTSFAADLQDLKAKTLSQIGVSATADRQEQAIAEKLLAARLLKASEEQSVTSAAFDEFFDAFTSELAGASNPGSVLSSSSRLGTLSASEALRVDSSYASVVDLRRLTQVLDFNRPSLVRLALSHFPQVRTEYAPSMMSCSIELSFQSTSAIWSRQFVVAEDGMVYGLRPGAAPIRSRMGAPMSPDAVLFSVFDSDTNIAANRITRAVIRMGESSITLGDGNTVLASGTNGSLSSLNLNSQAPVYLTTPTNRDGSLSLASSAGLWLTTDSSFATEGRTGLGHSVHYFVTSTTDGSILLNSHTNPETRANRLAPQEYVGLDFARTQNARILPLQTDLRTGFEVYLTGKHPFSPEMAPELIQSLAFARIRPSNANLSVTNAVESVTPMNRLSAQVSVSGDQVLVTAPLLKSMATQTSKIAVRSSTGGVVMADAGLRYGHYALTAHTGEKVWMAQAFSVDQNGQVYSHGGMNASTESFNRIEVSQSRGSVSTGFHFSMNASNLSTANFAPRLQGAGSQYYFQDSAQPPAVGAAMASVIATLKTTSNVHFMLHALTAAEWVSGQERYSIHSLLASPPMGGFDSASTQALLQTTEPLGLTTQDVAQELSYLLATPTNASSQDETSGFWLAPVAPGTSVSSSSLSTRVTDGVTPQMLDQGFLRTDIHLLVCVNGSGCFDAAAVRGWSQGFERHYGYSRLGLDMIRPANRQSLVAGPKNLQSGAYELRAYWNPFAPSNSNGRMSGILVASSAIPQTGTSMTLSRGSFDLPRVVLSY